MPTKIELEALRRGGAVILRIFFLDGKYCTLRVDSWTTARETEDTIAKLLNIGCDKPFSLFEVSSGEEERVLDPDERVLDLVSFWQRTGLEDMAKAGKSKWVWIVCLCAHVVCRGWTCDVRYRELPIHSYVYTFIWPLDMSLAPLAWCNHPLTHLDTHPYPFLTLTKYPPGAVVEEFRFLYKVGLFYDVDDADTSAVELMYIQATHDIVDSRYPCSEQDAITLAALQMQENFGDFPASGTCTHLRGKLGSYLSSRLIETTPASELEEQVGAVVCMVHVSLAFQPNIDNDHCD